MSASSEARPVLPPPPPTGDFAADGVPPAPLSNTSAGIPAASELRLHPFSWLFVLITQLRSMLLPLIALIFFGRGSSWDLLGGVAAIGVAIYAFIYSRGFRYRIGENELMVKEGLFDRTERHIPFSRVQNITQARNALHQLFGVTELRLESAGGSKPEAVMNVIPVQEAERLERIIKRREVPADSNNASNTGASGESAQPLLNLNAGELFRLGLVSNQGWVLLAAIAAASWQFGDDGKYSNEVGSFLSQAMQWLKKFVWQGMGPDDWWMIGIRALEVVVVFWLLLRLLSIALVFLKFHGFRLERHDDTLRAESGLLTRVRASAALDRVQRLDVREPMVLRWLGRRTLGVNVLGTKSSGDGESNENDKHRLKWLAPIATPEQIESVVHGLFDHARIPAHAWQRLHPRAARREAKQGLWFFIPAVVASYFTPWGVLGFGVAMLLTFGAVRSVQETRYALTDKALALRTGWWSKRWILVPREKMQAIRLNHSVFDRKAGMANLDFDISGGDATSFAISIPYLPKEEAERLYASLQREGAGAA